MTQIHVVMKPLTTANGLLPSGAVVDASQWRNLAKLVSQRYLRLATADEAATIIGKPETEKTTFKNKGVKQNGN